MNLSGTQTVLYLILALVFGFVGYRLSENFRRLTGRTPWGMSSLLWAFIWFLSLLIGVVLYVIARSTTKLDPRGPAPVAPKSGWPAGPSAGAQSGSALPGRYPSRVAPRDEIAAPVGAATPVPDPESLPTVSPPMWHVDPSGKFEYRWWDGTRWTSRVARGGVQLEDPITN